MPDGQYGYRRHIAVLADETRQFGTQVGPAVLRPVPQLAPQQSGVQRGELGRRIGPQLLGQQLPSPLVDGQRLGATPGLGQRPHEGSDEPLPKRMGGDKLGQLGHHLGATPEPDVRVHPIPERGDVQLVQPGSGDVERLAVTQGDVRHGRPRHSSSPDRSNSARASGSAVRACPTIRSNRPASTSSDPTASRYPPASASTTPSGNTLRSRDTSACRAFTWSDGGCSPRSSRPASHG